MPLIDNALQLACLALTAPAGLVTRSGQPVQTLAAAVVPPGYGIASLLAFSERVAASGGPLIQTGSGRDDAAAHTGTSGDPAPFRFAVGVPIIGANGKPMGALVVADFAARLPLAAKDVAAMGHVAALLPALLQNPGGQPAPEAETPGVSVNEKLLEITADLADLPAVLKAAADVIIEATGADICLFHRQSPDGRTVRLVGGSGRGVFSEPATIAALHWDPMAAGTTQIGAAIGNPHPIVIAELVDIDPDLHPRVREIVALGLKTYISVPIELGGRHHAVSAAFAVPPADYGRLSQQLQGAVPALRMLIRRVRELEHTNMLRGAIEVSPNPVIITEAEPIDQPGPRIVYVNQAFVDDTGYSAAEAIGQTPRMLQGPETSIEGRGAIRNALGGWKPVRQELLNYRKDGTPFWNEISIAPLMDSTGWYTHWVSVNRDTTEIRQANQHLQDSLQDLQILIDELPGALQRLRLSPEGSWEVIYTSPAVFGLFGYTPEEFRAGVHRRSSVTHEDVAVLQEAMSLATAEGSSSAEVTWKHPDGRVLVVGARFRSVTRSDGIKEIFAIWTDATEARERMAQLANAGRRLTSLGEMAASLAHELAQPLGTLLIQIDMIKTRLKGGRAEPDVLLQVAERMFRQTERATAILHNIHDYTRPATRHDAVLRLEEAVSVAVGLTSGSVDAAGYGVRVTMPEDLPLIIGQKTGIEQVVMNLIGNARDALRMGGHHIGRISITGEAAEDHVLLYVSDTAGGVPPDLIERIFVPFFTTKDPDSGTGLGLSICRSAMHAMGGEITVENGPEGAIFTLRLRRAPAGATVG